MGWSNRVCKILDRRELHTPSFDSLMMVVEVPPHRQTVWYLGEPHEVPLPWMYYRMNFMSGLQRWGIKKPPQIKIVSLGCSPKQVKYDSKGVIYHFFFPNMYAFSPCYGGYFWGLDEKIKFETKDEQTNIAATCLASFWGQTHNNDGENHYHSKIFDAIASPYGVDLDRESDYYDEDWGLDLSGFFEGLSKMKVKELLEMPQWKKERQDTLLNFGIYIPKDEAEVAKQVDNQTYSMY